MTEKIILETIQRMRESLPEKEKQKFDTEFNKIKKSINISGKRKEGKSVDEIAYERAMASIKGNTKAKLWKKIKEGKAK